MRLPAVQFHRCPYLCPRLDALFRRSSNQPYAIPMLCSSHPFLVLSILYQCDSCLCLCLTELYGSIPSQFYPICSIAYRHYPQHFRCLSNLFQRTAYQCVSFAKQIMSTRFLFSSCLFFSRASPLVARANHYLGLLFHSRSFTIFSVSLPCRYWLLLCSSYPIYAIAQVNRPLPAFRHCPIPLY